MCRPYTNHYISPLLALNKNVDVIDAQFREREEYMYTLVGKQSAY